MEEIIQERVIMCPNCGQNFATFDGDTLYLSDPRNFQNQKGELWYWHYFISSDVHTEKFRCYYCNTSFIVHLTPKGILS